MERVSLWILMLIFLARLTKRAQYPFSAWLPLAMAAPTPVSALVHSSTLVTAGVFILVRFYHLVAMGGPLARAVLLVSRSLTMVLAGFAAFVETDLKKVIAYSTLSQLGVMVIALGLGRPGLALFHLLSHALFKALIFLCAGRLIHYHGHSQDLRLMGGLGEAFPVTQLGLVVSMLALCGFPFFSGFYSKDPIYELAIAGGANYFCLFFVVLGLFITTVYSFRVLCLLILFENNQVPLACFGNGVSYFTIPVISLMIGAVCWGAMLNWLLPPPIVLSPIRLAHGLLPMVIFFFAVRVAVGVNFDVSGFGCVFSGVRTRGEKP